MAKWSSSLRDVKATKLEAAGRAAQGGRQCGQSNWPPPESTSRCFAGMRKNEKERM